MWKECLITIVFVFSFAFADTFRDQELTPEARAAIEKGLSFLQKSQYPSGAWHCDVGFKLNNDYRPTKSNAAHVGVTALACLALMSDGNLPDRGRYGVNVRKGLNFILSSVQNTGYIRQNGSRMYSHAFATLFLAQIYGMTRDIEVREKLERAVNLIVESQNERGGWRYEPNSLDVDMSVTVCQIQALRSARNVGIRVSKKHIDRALEYLQRSATYTGGFKYQDLPMGQTRITFAVTAAGITSLYGAGVYDGKPLERALDYLMNPPRNDPHPPPYHYFYFYGHYYAVQAMFMAGENFNGKNYWGVWFPRVRDQLTKVQNLDGSWEDNVGKTCATSLALIVLQVPNRYLPIFQK